VGLVVTAARCAMCAAFLAGLVCLTACSSGLGMRGTGDQSSMPSSIVVNFKVGVPPHQATAEVKKCHPLALMGTDTTRERGRSSTSILIWGPQGGTAGASALYHCLKAAPGVADQNWPG
jgi:hypothetical protein